MIISKRLMHGNERPALGSYFIAFTMAPGQLLISFSCSCDDALHALTYATIYSKRLY